MQRHPRPSGHRKTKDIVGSQKEKKVHNKKAKEINQSSPTESPRPPEAPFPPVKNYNKEPKQPMSQPRIVTLGGSEDSDEPSLDYSTPCILSTSAGVKASQKCTDNTEPPSLPSISCEATDPCAASMSTGSDSPRLLAALVQMLELKREKISLTGKLRLEEGLHNYLRVSIVQECEEGMMWRGRIISSLSQV